MKSVVAGKQWESIFERTAHSQGVTCIRMPDGCRVVGPNKLIRVRTPFDYILIHKSTSVYLDCKSFDSDQITYSMIKDHQMATLLDIEISGCPAGYLIYFRKSNVICFAKASQLSRIQPETSLHGREMIILGQLESFAVGRLFTLNWEDPKWTLTS